MDRLKKFFVNGLFVTAVSLLIRYVSVQFNVYISNKIGSVAMGLFTLISSVYGFALTIATSGISLATTKLVSEAMGRDAKEHDGSLNAEVGSVMKKSILFSLSLSFGAAVLLFVLSPLIGERILGDIRTISSLKILSFSLVPIALSSSLCGYFTAVRKAYKNAALQITSQILRMYLCILFLSSVMGNDMESACVCIVLGGVLSEAITFVLQAVLYAIERAKQKPCAKKNISDESVHTHLSKKLLKITLPVAFGAYMRSALVTLEHLLIPWGLERSGTSRDDSLSAYGTVHSIVFPLVLFPSAISSSFAGLLVPEISESDAQGDTARIERIISRVLKTVLIYSIGVAGVMMCLADEIGEVLFFGTGCAKYTALIAPLIPIMYLDTSVDSILKGLGYQFYTMVVNIVDASLSVILVLILLPRFGIWGYIITVYFTETVNATLSITKLLLVSRAKPKIWEILVKPLACIILSTKLTHLILTRFCMFAVNTPELVIHICMISVLYILSLIICRAISPKKIMRSVKNFLRPQKNDG